MKKLKKINREFWLDEIKEYVINDMTENKVSIDECLGCLQILHIQEWYVEEEDPYSWREMRYRDMVEFEEIHQLEKHIGKEEVKEFLKLCKLGASGEKNTHETALYTDGDDDVPEYLTSLIFTQEDFMELLMVDCDECYTKVAFCDSTPLEDYDDDWIRICKDCA